MVAMLRLRMTMVNRDDGDTALIKSLQAVRLGEDVDHNDDDDDDNDDDDEDDDDDDSLLTKSLQALRLKQQTQFPFQIGSTGSRKKRVIRNMSGICCYCYYYYFLPPPCFSDQEHVRLLGTYYDGDYFFSPICFYS